MNTGRGTTDIDQTTTVNTVNTEVMVAQQIKDTIHESITPGIIAMNMLGQGMSGDTIDMLMMSASGDVTSRQKNTIDITKCPGRIIGKKMTTTVTTITPANTITVLLIPGITEDPVTRAVQATCTGNSEPKF